ncbi:hypothetical protein NMY22_g13019 [Coprinellus aureogranulatus]|nr:hypothetical protein NMY22_g13019 [Coprinellus aureogranulatus]
MPLVGVMQERRRMYIEGNNATYWPWNSFKADMEAVVDVQIGPPWLRSLRRFTQSQTTKAALAVGLVGAVVAPVIGEQAASWLLGIIWVLWYFGGLSVDENNQPDVNMAPPAQGANRGVLAQAIALLR